MTDVDIVLTYLICLGQVKGLQTSTLTFYIAQFFSLLNHQILFMILDKAGFNSRILSFYSKYLIDIKIQYIWNNLILSFFKTNIGVGQGSALFLILSTLYIALISHIFEKRPKNLFQNLAVSFLSFIDDGFFILQEIFSKNQKLFFFVVIILLFLFLIKSDLQSSMESWKSFTFLD